MITRVLLPQRYPASLAGRVNTGLNVVVFLTAFGGQWAIGAMINLWPKSPDGGYARTAYQISFGVMIAIEVLSLLWFIVASHIGRRSESQSRSK